MIGISLNAQCLSQVFQLQFLFPQIQTRRRNIYFSRATPSYSSPFQTNFGSILTSFPFISISSCRQTQTIFCATMEDYNNTAFEALSSDKYFKELEIAVKAVQMACWLCQRIQQSLLSKTNDHVQSKDDNSPVTIAGNSFTLFLKWAPVKVCSLYLLLLFCWFSTPNFLSPTLPVF